MILIVDDHIDTGAALAGLVRVVCGHDTVAVTSGKAAMAFLKTTRPVLMIVDVMMPEMSGLEVLAAVRHLPGIKDLPVVSYSADTSIATKQEAIRLRATDFLIKGVVDWTTLEKTICKYVAE